MPFDTRLCLWVTVSLERVYSSSMAPYTSGNGSPFRSFTTLFSLVEFLPFLFHEFVECVEIDVSKDWRAYTSYKVATLPIELATSIPRPQLRPGYGDGLLGAPLQRVPSRKRPAPRVAGDPRGTSRPPR